MIQVNASAWGDWEAMFNYIREMVSKGFKIQIINASYLLELWHSEELQELGLKKVEA